MKDKDLQALIKKTMAKAQSSKPKGRPSYDSTLEATKPKVETKGTDAEEIFEEMKKRTF